MTFCKQIAKKPPILIRLKPEPWALPHHCFRNCERMVGQHGGRSQVGWQFALRRLGRAGVLIAIHHCIWRSAEDQLTDITNPPNNLLLRGKGIVFLLDKHATLIMARGCRKGIPRPSLFFPVSKGAETEELLARLRRIEEADLLGRLSMCRAINSALGTISGQKESSSVSLGL